MGQGRVHGSQVGTQGTQGRVYAITPQTESVNQSIIQSMFLLLLLWARVLFDSVAYACDCVCKFWGRNSVKGGRM